MYQDNSGDNLSRPKRPLSGLLIVSAIAVLFLVLNRDFVKGCASQLGIAPKSSLSGEWVGVLDVYQQDVKLGFEDPVPVHKKAAFRVRMTISDSFLEKYSGDGEMWISGESKPHAVFINGIELESNPKDGTLDDAAFLWGDGANDTTPDSPNGITGALRGKFQPNALQLQSKEDKRLGFYYRGVLHKGNESEYQQLVSSLR